MIVRLTQTRPRATQWGALAGLDAPGLAAAPGDPESGGIAGAGAISPPTVVNAPFVPPTPPSVCYADFRAFLADMEASTEFTDWCSAEPGDCATWTTYSHVILAGGSPSPPAMSTIFGDALVDAGIIALDGINSCRASLAPHAAFTYVRLDTGLTIMFTNLSSPGVGAFVSYLWDFGDGSTDSTTWNPAHVYAAPGTYLVTLTVTTNIGGDSVTHLVNVFVFSGVAFHIDTPTL